MIVRRSAPRSGRSSRPISSRRLVSTAREAWAAQRRRGSAGPRTHSCGARTETSSGHRAAAPSAGRGGRVDEEDLLVRRARRGDQDAVAALVRRGLADGAGRGAARDRRFGRSPRTPRRRRSSRRSARSTATARSRASAPGSAPSRSAAPSTSSAGAGRRRRCPRAPAAPADEEGAPRGRRPAARRPRRAALRSTARSCSRAKSRASPTASSRSASN